MSEFKEYITSKIYDLASSTGTLAAYRRVDKTQVSNIIEVFESEADPLSAIKLTIAFIARQIGRRELYFDVGSKIINDLREILDKFKDNSSLLRAITRKYLYLFKWFYESGVGKKVSSFDEFLNQFMR